MQRLNRSRLLATSCFAGVCLLAASALARQTFSGASCVPESWNAAFSATLSKIFVGADGVVNTDTINTTLICPTPVTSILGPNASWEVTVTDNSATSQLLCRGTVSDSSGAVIATTPNVLSGAPFTGTTTLVLNTSAGGFSNLHTHTVRCIVPPDARIRSSSVP